jgi:hypothetical protein
VREWEWMWVVILEQGNVEVAVLEVRKRQIHARVEVEKGQWGKSESWLD